MRRARNCGRTVKYVIVRIAKGVLSLRGKGRTLISFPFITLLLFFKYIFGVSRARWEGGVRGTRRAPKYKTTNRYSSVTQVQTPIEGRLECVKHTGIAKFKI